MANIINLRRARKAKLRTQDDVKADENRSLFGRTKHEKRREENDRQALVKHLDGAKRDKPDNLS